MIESLPLIVAFIGSIISSIYDLKTTEVPDKLLHTMMLFGLLFYTFQSFILSDYKPIMSSALVGFALLGLGFLMYYFGQWGGADAKLLGAIGFLLPTKPPSSKKTIFPFPLSFLLNVFLIGAGYIIFYAVAYSLINRKVLKKFFEEMKAERRILVKISGILFLLFLSFNIIILYELKVPFRLLRSIFTTSLVVGSILSLYVVWKFAKIVEKVGFRKRVPIDKLKVGDVLLSSRVWRGISEKELKELKKSERKYVWIKEGVRFVPTFPLALLFTLFYGDCILWLVKI